MEHGNPVRRLRVVERICFEGEFYRMEEAGLEFKPVKKRIHVYLDQQGPYMMRLTGEIADGVILTLVCSKS
jgi:alkanesulfonate monooxygenase SsuD/methylene tetrahydromethanopterin reductase-like flavin-dependent oxidoreductase (luciferase family)